jgi:hypothetical protein
MVCFMVHVSYIVSSSCRLDEPTPKKVMGKVVVCSNNSFRSGIYIQWAGGAGIVSVETIEGLFDS